MVNHNFLTKRYIHAILLKVEKLSFYDLNTEFQQVFENHRKHDCIENYFKASHSILKRNLAIKKLF